MKNFGDYFLLTSFSVLIFAFGCSTTSSNPRAKANKDATTFASPSQLSATLTNGNNVILNWKNNATAEGGNWVEFATPGSEYVKLDVFMSDGGTTFLHPRLAPQTTFIYHILPFFGKATAPVEITTGIASTNNAPELEEGPIVSTNEISSGENTPQFSIRKVQTFTNATPTDLTAALSSPTSVDLHWKDRASDEDGYLLEIGPGTEEKFYVCALLPANTTSFRKTGLPSETKCYFRVRAFFYGKPSDTASATTP